MNWQLFWKLWRFRFWMTWERGGGVIITPWFALVLAYWACDYSTGRLWSGARFAWKHDKGWNTPEGCHVFNRVDRSLEFFHSEDEWWFAI